MTDIRYAQCWEDPATLTEGLEVTPKDDVVSIGSGGDNSFALLLSRPRSLTIVDMNPAQLFLVELKMRAIQKLDYCDFISFVGARPCPARNRLYRFLRSSLSESARRYWDGHAEAILKGVIHCGKFEKYFALFRTIILPLVHSRKVVEQFMALSSLNDQRTFYDEVWNNLRWRSLFHVFFGRFLLGHLGRDPSCFDHVSVDSVAEELLRRTRRGATEIPIGTNFFIEYILTGRYQLLENAHPYLNESNFCLLQDSVSKVRLIEGNLAEYLKRTQPGSVSKFNLSDIFEYMSQESFEQTLDQIVHASSSPARLAYWTLFVPRCVPTVLSRRAVSSRAATNLYDLTRTFFYGSFNLWNINYNKLRCRVGVFSENTERFSESRQREPWICTQESIGQPIRKPRTA
ncbi:MAG: DUF3419 family protein [Deltaproteobacteria bacterium]|nr:DUF3419 family protein [Deltaproteobacteria bacterium]